ncbi:hypothetical protein JCM3770_002837 [Rhodotorula araucariae]
MAPTPCRACTRADPARAFFCQDCIASCLKDHHARRQQLRNALTLVTAKATALLQGRQHSLGVNDERRLKADKWSLASRAYAARDAVAKAKVANDAAASDVQARRANLAARRANLATARSLLAGLASPAPSTSSLSLPDSLPALEARLSTLTGALAALEAETDRVRRILARELVAVFALAPVDRPLADPFLPFPTALGNSTYPPPSGPPPLYTLATLPLPALSALLALPPSTLEALLAHLAHLARLVALYERVALPFTPLPGAFGPGRAGIRAAPGWGVDAAADGAHGAGPRAGPGAARSRRGLGAEVWPLVFGSRRGSRGARGDGAAAPAVGPAAAAGVGVGLAGAPREPEDPPSEGEDDARSERSSDASASHLSAAAAKTKRGKRARLVLAGAVALALDFAYIAWTRDGRAGVRTDWRVEELDDLGALVARAASVADEEKHGEGQAQETKQRERDAQERPPVFPLDLDAALAHYAALAFGPASTPASHTGKSRAELEESGVVVEGGEAAEDDEDEGWDLVSV